MENTRRQHECELVKSRELHDFSRHFTVYVSRHSAAARGGEVSSGYPKVANNRGAPWYDGNPFGTALEPATNRLRTAFFSWKILVIERSRQNEPIKRLVDYQTIQDRASTYRPGRLRSASNHFFAQRFAYVRYFLYLCTQICISILESILPYEHSSEGVQSIEANKEYLFFSAVVDKKADEYTLNTQLAREQNILYVVFSPNRFTKANDTQGGKNWQDEQLPRTLKYEPFLRWLYANQTKDELMVVRTEVITIIK